MNRVLKKAVVLAWLGVTPVVSGWAQSEVTMEKSDVIAEKSEPPRAPYIAPLPKFARYEVRVEGAGAQGLNRLIINKLDEKKGITGVFGGGKTQEYWLCRGMMLVKLPGVPQALTYHPGNIEMDLPVFSGDFNGFEWLSASNYAGMVTFEGRKCYRFGTGVAQQALIDLETKFPVLLKQGNLLYHFEYGPPPQETLNWPSEFEEGWKLYQAQLKSITGRSPAR